MAADKDKPKKEKEKKDKKGKGKGSEAQAAVREPKPGALSLSLAEHPRAVQRIKQAKELGGLAGFLIGAYLTYPTHTIAETGVRALMAGIACYVAMWGLAVFLWRHLVVAELRSREHSLMATELAKLEGRTDVSASPVERAGAGASP